jgi:hypothetical protein
VHDARLDRGVAVKVLPEGFAAGGSRVNASIAKREPSTRSTTTHLHAPRRRPRRRSLQTHHIVPLLAMRRTVSLPKSRPCGCLGVFGGRPWFARPAALITSNPSASMPPV